jgi:hypothetical protein
VEQANYTEQKAWTGNRFLMHVLQKENSNTKRLTYKSLVPSVIVFVAPCWIPCRKGKINTSGRVQQTAFQFQSCEES